MTAEMFKLIARFENERGEPLGGEGYRVHLRDKDRFFDDLLGESPLAPDGTAEFLLFTVDIASIDSPHERTPDIYFVVERDGREVHRTEVIENVSFDSENPVTGRPTSLTREFGPFTIGGKTE